MAGRARGRAMSMGSGDDPLEEMLNETSPTEMLGRGRGRGRRRPTSSSPSSESPPKSPSNSASSSSPSSSPELAISSLRVADKDDGRRQDITVADPNFKKMALGHDGDVFPGATNYIRIIYKEGTTIYEYHVNFNPDVDSLKDRRTIMRSQPVVDVIGEVQAFTGMNLFLPKKLDNIKIEAAHPNTKAAVSVTIIYIKAPPTEELTPFYNTLFRRIMNQLKLVQINRYFYQPSAKVMVPQHKLEIWPGWVTAVQEHDGGLMLVCDASHRVLRTSTARDMLMEIRNNPKANFKDAATKALVGAVVLTRYNNRPYRVDEIDFTKNPQHTFTKSDGTKISYIDYFKDVWNIEVKDRQQPLIINRPKPKRGQVEESRLICLIPELCYLTGLTDDIRSDVRAMRDIASHTRIPPQTRVNNLIQFIKSINTTPEAKTVFEQWGLTLQSFPLTAQLRKLPREALIFGGKETTANDQADWTRDATNSRLIQPIEVKTWVLVYTKRDENQARELCQMLVKVSRAMGFTFATPIRAGIDNDLPATYCNAIREKFQATPGVQLVVILTPGTSQREDRYNAVKKLCCCDLAVPSQVLRCAIVSDPNKQRAVCQKVALQISCKIGGELWGVKIPFKSVMFIGIDVYHDASQKGRSCVAVVCSINPAVTRWYSTVVYQGPNEEISSHLQKSLVEALQKYNERNGRLPERIFIYRDGVGDGQLDVVKNFENAQITQALGDYLRDHRIPDPRPKVTTMVIQKRINTKIFHRSGPTSVENPPPGTVLDKEVTRSNLNDFYLVSQHVRHGTVTPTHYVVLVEENDIPLGRLQRLSYKLTHLYYNWPGTVRVPAPCQYAHKIAYLAGQNLRSAVPDPSLRDKLFYL